MTHGNELQLEEGDVIIHTEKPTSCPCRIPCIVVFLSICLTLTIIALVVVTGMHTHTVNKNSDVQNVCSDPGLVQQAASIVSKMDLGVKACDNFYNYACGEFRRNAIVPPGSPAKTSLRDVQQTYYVRLYNLLRRESSPTSKNWTDYPGVLLNNCLDSVKSAEGFQLTSLDSSVFKSILGLENPNQMWTLGDLIAATGSQHLSSFVSISDEMNNRDNPLNERVGISFQSALKNWIFLKSEDPSKLISDALNILIPKKDANYKLLVVNYVNSIQKKLQEIEADTTADKVLCEDWQMFSTKFLQRLEIQAEQFILPIIQSNNNDRMDQLLKTIKERKTCYSEKVLQILMFLKQQSIEEVSKIALLNAVMRSSRMLNSNFKQWYSDNSVIQNSEGIINPDQIAPQMGSEDEAQWQRCVGLLDHTMRPIIAPRYQKNYLVSDDLVFLRVIITNVKISFKRNVEEMDWLDEKEKKAVYNKIDAMKLNIAYPPIFDNHSFSANVYSNQYITHDAYKDNGLSAFLSSYRLHHRYTIQSNLVKNTSDWLELEYNPSQPSYLFYDLTNDVFFPQNILQRPYYDREANAFLNYGGIGFIAGHEILHAFDPNGHHVRSTTRSNETLWLETGKAETTYHKKLKQIDTFYKELMAKEMPGNVRVKSWLANDIADMGGLKAALRGYQLSNDYSGGSATLAGLSDFNKEQLFFLNYAQMFCSSSAPDSSSVGSQRDIGHSPDKIRVLGTLMNSEEFAKAYYCSSGDKMNPPTKYSLW